MNQTVFCVTPSAWAISQEETPFLALTIIHTHGNHFSSGNGLASKIVPDLIENRCRHDAHRQRLTV